MSDRFGRAIEVILANEGGYNFDPRDPGGETNWGISKRQYPDLDLKNLTLDQAREIYRHDWWERYGYGKILNEDLSIKLFDFSINMGPHAAHRLLQRVLKEMGMRIVCDGILGKETIEAANQACSLHGIHRVLMALKLEAIRYYLDLNNHRFLAGWVRRAIS